ncbi:MAG: hypothetical protein FWD60_11430 [Candidatus Azobacteroides sp.]|nr:hypothetical protein [Candidatus Azobacteroides sp.]
MKKIFIICLILIPFAIIAQEKTLLWDYPVKPGMEKWSQFKSMDEMYQSCQIPDAILKRLDTESLVDICLNFPAPPVFPLFNTPQEGFMTYYNNFNGIRELFNRKDAGQYLLKKYSMMSLSDFNPLWPLYRQGQFISHYKFVEAILSQSPIIESLDANGRKALLNEAIRKLDEKKSKSDLFGGSSFEINAWIIGKVLYSENKLVLQGYSQECIQTSIESGLLLDIDVNTLYQEAKSYSYENK